MSTVTRYGSCNRTKGDEQSLFVRFQLLCLILGTLSFVWVRRYRVVYASLFEQRKMSVLRRPSDGLESNGSTGGGGGGGAGSIEMATREEVAPLTNNLEVV